MDKGKQLEEAAKIYLGRAKSAFEAAQKKIKEAALRGI